MCEHEIAFSDFCVGVLRLSGDNFPVSRYPKQEARPYFLPSERPLQSEEELLPPPPHTPTVLKQNGKLQGEWGVFM